jgi:hypothetical protein
MQGENKKPFAQQASKYNTQSPHQKEAKLPIGNLASEPHHQIVASFYCWIAGIPLLKACLPYAWGQGVCEFIVRARVLPRRELTRDKLLDSWGTTHSKNKVVVIVRVEQSGIENLPLWCSCSSLPTEGRRR